MSWFTGVMFPYIRVSLQTTSPVIASVSLPKWHWTWAFINHPVLETFHERLNNPAWDLFSTSVLLPLPPSHFISRSPSLPPCPKLSSQPSVMRCLWALLLLCPDDHCHRELPITDAAWWTMLPRRAADTPVSLAAETLPRQPAQDGKEWGQGGPGGAGLRTCPSSRRQDAHTLPHPFSSSLYSANGNMGLVSMAMAMMLSLILRWWKAPLPFTWIYIYIWTDTVRDPRPPPEATQGAPKG